MLPPQARDTTKVLFSDSPRGLENCGQTFKNLLGLAEDAIHLMIRVQACFGETRSALSCRVLLLQTKFRNRITVGTVYHGQAKTHGPEGVWDLNAPRQQVVGRDWDAYVQMPYSSHQEYINDLVELVREFPQDMEKKDSKGRTVEHILEHGSRYKHFGYLQNGGLLLGMLPGRETTLLHWGTTGNEALHMQLKMVFQTVTQQHESRVKSKTFAFSLDHMLAHNSAAYTPTTIQRSQQVLLSVLQGTISQTFFPESHADVKTIDSRAIARSRGAKLDPAKTRASKEMVKVQQLKWKKQEQINDAKKRERPNRINVAIVCPMKRTVFTKQKETPLRRKPAARKPILKKRPSARRDAAGTK